MKSNLIKGHKMNNDILTVVLGWMSCDLKFLENKINDFELDIEAISDELDLNNLDKTNINNWIYIVIYSGAYNFLTKVQDFANENGLKFVRSMVDIKIFTNYSESFLNGKILNKDIDITDFSEDNLKSFIKKVMEV